MPRVPPQKPVHRDIPIVGGWSSQNKHEDHRALEGALKALRADTQGTAKPAELQLIVQFCEQRDFSRWAAGWRAAWGDAGFATPTIQWPRGLPTGQTAALLVPLLAGRVGPAIGKHPTPVFEPVLVHALLPEGVGASDLALNVILRWLASRTAGQGALLAPPVLELARGGAIVDRRLETYNVKWDLPAPDGL